MKRDEMSRPRPFGLISRRPFRLATLFSAESEGEDPAQAVNDVHNQETEQADEETEHKSERDAQHSAALATLVGAANVTAPCNATSTAACAKVWEYV